MHRTKTESTILPVLAFAPRALVARQGAVVVRILASELPLCDTYWPSFRIERMRFGSDGKCLNPTDRSNGMVALEMRLGSPLEVVKRGSRKDGQVT